ncbi:glutathionyl-hydroquinone reductase [Rathayibacter tanaceti]|uniref:Glutathionyl-hydroquinone reductase n=2 Tax=Rathayibacter tanaceti TaxID=1671680 RepID=A0ACD2XLQ8_9MICO|nr:Glutathionyl-hydroquinone reductase YqjG [Rathayibacter tanaceti]TCO38536.1 glutathionyl-hydroquinone reductase [Rathayibacter tanaceti]
MTSDDFGSYVEKNGFHRDTTYIPTRITADGRDGYPAEAGRYRLVVSRACPWANRAVIVRRLLGLEDALSMGICGPTHDKRSWTFDLDPGGVDPVLGIPRLQDAFFARFPDYPRGITVPAVVDIPSGQVVTNDYPVMTLDFSTEWTAFHREGAPDLYPEEHRDEIDEVAELVFHDVNNGVYKCGFAGSQRSYDRAYGRLWARLDWLEERLSTRRYLVGDTITEADVRLFTTLARFDAVYYSHFKTNRNLLSAMPALWGYARDLFPLRGSATPSTSCTSSRTTTRCSATSTRPESCRRAPICPAGWSPPAARSSAAAPSATALPRRRRSRPSACPRGTERERSDSSNAVRGIPRTRKSVRARNDRCAAGRRLGPGLPPAARG